MLKISNFSTGSLVCHDTMSPPSYRTSLLWIGTQLSHVLLGDPGPVAARCHGNADPTGSSRSHNGIQVPDLHTSHLQDGTTDSYSGPAETGLEERTYVLL